MNNQEYYSSITTLLLEFGWKKEACTKGTMTAWTKPSITKKIMMPTEEFVDDEHAVVLYNKAIKALSTYESVSEEVIQNKLKNYVSYADVISVRTSGGGVEHGRINLFSANKSISAITMLIKACTLKHANAKRGFKKQLEEHYLSCVNLVAPQAGSFIHRLEVDLKPFTAELKTKSEENGELDHEPVNRSINVKLAQLLISLRDIDHNKITLPNLLKLGVTERVSTSLIEVFSDEVDNVEYGFNWSPSYEAPKLSTNNIVFSREHREKFKKIKAIFTDADSFDITDQAAHIEGYFTPEEGDSGLLLRLKLEGRSRNCEVITTRQIVEKLMSELSEDSQQLVSVTGKITKVTSNNQTSYNLTEATISATKSKQIPLLG
ncbi:hypothetical protein BUN10_24100 [Vibrio parahaemolyticus]|nr:hypothetical protein BUN10_24100 [Vibrio parahaemolyticus]